MSWALGSLAVLHVCTCTVLCVSVDRQSHLNTTESFVLTMYTGPSFTVCFSASRVITVGHGWHAFPSPLVSRGTAIMFFLYACASGSPEGRSDVTLLKKRFSIVCYNWILLEFNWLFIENRFTVIVLLKIHDHRWLWSAEAVSHLWLNKFRCFIWQWVSSRYMHSF